jgi:hypothetical protein
LTVARYTPQFLLGSDPCMRWKTESFDFLDDFSEDTEIIYRVLNPSRWNPSIFIFLFSLFILNNATAIGVESWESLLHTKA